MQHVHLMFSFPQPCPCGSTTSVDDDPGSLGVVVVNVAVPVAVPGPAPGVTPGGSGCAGGVLAPVWY